MNQKSNMNSAAISKLKLSTSTSIQALGLKAERAACIAEAVRKSRTRKEAPKRSRKPKKPIENSMDVIKQAVAKSFSETLEIVWEKPQRFSVAHASVKMYSKIAKAEYELKMLEWKTSGRDPKKKPKELLPDLMYVFYASSMHPDRLDSAAVYCKDALKMASSIKESGSFMNIRVRDVQMGTGRRPYVDVLL